MNKWEVIKDGKSIGFICLNKDITVGDAFNTDFSCAANNENNEVSGVITERVGSHFKFIEGISGEEYLITREYEGICK